MLRTYSDLHQLPLDKHHPHHSRVRPPLILLMLNKHVSAVQRFKHTLVVELVKVQQTYMRRQVQRLHRTSDE